VINAGLKRGLNRFKSQTSATGGQSAALAVIAQAAMLDPPQGTDPKDLNAWYEYCAEMRDASAAVTAAIHAGDEQQAATAMNRLTKSLRDLPRQVSEKGIRKQLNCLTPLVIGPIFPKMRAWTGCCLLAAQSWRATQLACPVRVR